MALDSINPTEKPEQQENQPEVLRSEASLTSPENNEIVIQSKKGNDIDLASLGFGTPTIVDALRDHENYDRLPASAQASLKNPAGENPETVRSSAPQTVGPGDRTSFDLTCQTHTKVVISLCICR